MNCSQTVAYERIVGNVTIRADAVSYELTRLPRGRICCLVETRIGLNHRSFPAQASPLTNLQRAMMMAKQQHWIPEETTLASCAVEVPCL